MRLAVVVLVAGCYRGTSQPALTNQSTTIDSTLMTVTAHGVGPIDSETKATLMDLRTLLVGYEVKPENDGALQFDIYRGGDKLAFVVPDENTGLVFNIHVISPRVRVVGHPWRVGHVFGDAAHLTNCECWGPNPTCYAAGEHIGVNFARDCDGLTGEDRKALRVLDGLTVQRVIWSPTPLGEAYGEEGD
jgi:hypothetical protein